MEIVSIGILFMVGVYIAPYVIGAVLVASAIVAALISSLFGRNNEIRY